MSRSQWIIGADPSSDVWIDHPEVSGSHCRLSKSEAGYFLEDLGSTNGTFCNGQPILASTKITSSDQVILGPSVPMPWPDPQLAKQVISIGYDQANRFRVNHESVSGRHAVLVVDPNDQFILFDRNSTNGTWVGECSITSAVVAETTPVRFGLSQSTIASILDAGGDASSSSEASHPNWLTTALMFGPATILAAVLLLLINSPTPESDDLASSRPKPVSKEPPNSDRRVSRAAEEPAANTRARAEADLTTSAVNRERIEASSRPEEPTEVAPRVANDTSEESSTTNPKKASSPNPAGPNNSIFQIVSEQGGVQFDFATAWAVTPSLLLTNAHVVNAMRRSGGNFSVVHIASVSEHRIKSTGVHEEYLELWSKLNKMLEIEKETGEAQSGTEIKNKIRRHLNSVDIGWIRLSEASNASPLRLRPVPLASGKTLRLISTSVEKNSPYPFELEEPPLIKHFAMNIAEEANRPPQRQNCIARFLPGSWSDYRFDGCPVIDLKGNFIGMYSSLETERGENEFDQPRPTGLLDRTELVGLGVIQDFVLKHQKENPL